MNDPRDSFLEGIDFEECRVIYTNSPIVLLCGGRVFIKENPDDPDELPKSLRDHINRQDPSFEIFRPEEIQDWQVDGVYKNLMDFEKDLAAISSLVVIVLESAGSIAELGAFSQLEEMQEKLYIVRPSLTTDDVSFINLGLIRFLKQGFPECVGVYPWDIEDLNSITSELVQDVIDAIGLKLSPSSTSVFKIDYGVSIVVAILEIVFIFSAVKETELLKYLKKIGFEINLEKLLGLIFLLKKFHLLFEAEYGDAKFYLRTDHPYHKLRIVSKHPDKRKKKPLIDVLRIRVQCINFYKETKDVNRSRVIQANLTARTEE